MNEVQVKFNARYLSTWTFDRLYRIYLTEAGMYFIRIGGQFGLGLDATGRFAVAEVSFPRTATKRREARLESLIEYMDSQNPRDLLAADKHNFEFPVRDIVQSRLEPPRRSTSHGVHFGRWVLKILKKRSMIFQFETLDEMREAFSKLPGILGSRLQVQTKWDPIENAFVKT